MSRCLLVASARRRCRPETSDLRLNFVVSLVRVWGVIAVPGELILCLTEY